MCLGFVKEQRLVRGPLCVFGLCEGTETCQRAFVCVFGLCEGTETCQRAFVKEQRLVRVPLCVFDSLNQYEKKIRNAAWRIL